MTKSLSHDRTAALLIFVPALITVAIMLHHPVLRHADRLNGATLAVGIGRIAVVNAIFHGIVLLLLCTQAIGLFSFAERLGLSSLWVRAGVIFYGLATIIMFVPATLDGFLTPLLGAGCMGDPPCATSLPGSIAFEWAAIQAFTRVALVLQALGLLGWSIALMQPPTRQRWAGLGGAVVAIIPLVMLSTMTQSINPARLEAIIAAEAIWSMAAAIMLWRGDGPRPVSSRSELS